MQRLSGGCAHCGPTDELGDEEDDAHHTFKRCEAFGCDRERLVVAIGGPFDPGDIVRLLMENPANYWGAVAKFAEDVMTASEEAENVRQSRQGLAPARFARSRATERRVVR